MLYERWRSVAESRPHQIALIDLAAGRRWSFAELDRAAERESEASGDITFPAGQRAEFVVAVLAAWRAERIVCPLEPGQKRPVIPEPLPQGIVHLKSTSASTAEARLVAFTAAQLEADANNIVQTMGLRPEWPNIGMVSLAHSYGFSNLVTPLLLHGIPLVIGEAPLPELLRTAAAEQGAVTIPAVPALWRTWLEVEAIPRNLRLAISAGAPLPLELERAAFQKFGVKIHNFYGSSECGGIAYDSSEEPRLDGSMVGAPMRNVQVSIGAGGCLEVRGAAVGQTYWPERANLGCGVFRTSDLGEIHDGLVYLRGRASDQINVAGRKISPEAIEKVLSTHPQVVACLAFGVPGSDPQRGETIVMCVQGQAGVSSEMLKQYALEHLPAWQVPRDWWFVNELRANERGKHSRASWRKRYLELKPSGRA